MSVNLPNLDWGGWVLGDVPHLLQLVCVEIGHGTEVVSASISLPTSEESLPGVQLSVADERGLTRLRETLLGNGFLLEPIPGSSIAWSAELPGYLLVVAVAGGEAP